MPAAYFVKTVENLRIVFIDSVILEGALATVDQRRFGDVYDPRVNGYAVLSTFDAFNCGF